MVRWKQLARGDQSQYKNNMPQNGLLFKKMVRWKQLAKGEPEVV
jgi:hypothetical protein